MQTATKRAMRIVSLQHEPGGGFEFHSHPKKQVPLPAGFRWDAADQLAAQRLLDGSQHCICARRLRTGEVGSRSTSGAA
jgi:hypothetical protein